MKRGHHRKSTETGLALKTFLRLETYEYISWFYNSVLYKSWECRSYLHARPRQWRLLVLGSGIEPRYLAVPCLQKLIGESGRKVIPTSQKWKRKRQRQECACVDSSVDGELQGFAA